MSATWTRCDSAEALEGITARWAARGQAVDWRPNEEEGGQHQARLRDEHGRVIEVAVLVVEVTTAQHEAVPVAAAGAAS